MEEEFWNVEFVGYRLPIPKLCQLLQAIDADPQEWVYALPDEGRIDVRDIGMSMSESLIARHLNLTWKHHIIGKDSLWLVGVSDFQPKHEKFSHGLANAHKNQYTINKGVVPMPIKPFKDLSLVDDFIFGEVMRQPAYIQPFLEALLEKKIERVVMIDKQKELRDEYDAHGIRLDVYLEDENHTKYDVEVQARLHPKLEKRIRYYQSGIDRRSLEAGSDYQELNDSYVIFICANDYFGAGLAVYDRESHIKGMPGIAYEDGSHAYILNADFTQGNANPEILDFLRYIRASYTGQEFDVSKSGYLRQIDTVINEIKSSSGRELEYMTLAMKMHDERWEGREEGRIEGLKEGRKEGKLEIAKRLLDCGFSVEDVSDMTGIDLDTVKKSSEEK